MKMWEDDRDGTAAVHAMLHGLGIPVFSVGDYNTPKAHFPKMHPKQVDIYNTAGLDKIYYTPGGPYTVRVGKVVTKKLNSDHDLHVAPVSLLIDGKVVFTFRLGTANIRHDMTRAHKLADIRIVHAECDVVGWQETDTDAANQLIDEVFAPADWYHLFPTLETDMSIRRAKFELVTKAALPKGLKSAEIKKQISDGVAHISPDRYDVAAVVTPLTQKAA